jgi:hypothetical protein
LSERDADDECDAEDYLRECMERELMSPAEEQEAPEPQPARPCRLIRSGKWCIEHNAACPEPQPAATVFLHRHDAAMYASPAPAARPQGGEALEALRWLVNVACGVGKAGGEPEPGEFEAAVEAGKSALGAAGEGEEKG